MIKKHFSDVFIVIHNKEIDKIYSHSTSKDFSLEKITALILREVQTGAFLKKNQIHEQTDFE